MSSLENERHIDSSFPFETIRVFDRSTKEKSIGEMSENLARWRSNMVARTYYSSKKERSRISRENFKLVYWEGMGRHTKTKLRRYQDWLTKQANGACACHGHLLKWLRKDGDREIKDECPCCGRPEPSTHVTRCEVPDRKALFMDSVSKVEQWLQKNTTEPGLQRMLVSYLKERGTAQMSDLLPQPVQGTLHQMMNRYAKIAEVQDRLGWDCLLEGRIPLIFVQHQHEHIKSTQNQMTSKRWAEGIIQQLTGVVDKQ